MKRNKSLFGTSGIRGSAEELFTPQFCFDIGRTFVQFLKTKNLSGPIAVGMDPRASSPRIKRDLFRGLETADVELFDEGISPIPSMCWLLKKTSLAGAVMITGSHIAPELNGLKFFALGEEILEDDERLIEKLYYSLKEKVEYTKTEPTATSETKARDMYVELLRSLVSAKWPSWKVALDCANGAQSVVIPTFLRGLGIEVFEINCDPDQDFIGRDTDAEDKAEIEGLKKLVIDKQCDFGIAFDGDGDRCVFIDEKGKFVQGEYSCSLIAREVKTDSIVTTFAASQVVESIGKKVIRTKVGSPYVIGKMKETGSLFGFEQNGGTVSGEIMYTRDGGTTMVKLLNYYSSFSGSFSQFVGQLPKFYMERTKVDYKWEQQQEILEKAKEKFNGIKVEEQDGLKIWLDETTWMLFRSSQNAPEFRVFAESKDEKKAKELLKQGVDFVESVIKGK